MAGVAADMGAGEIELFAEEMNEQQARLDVGLDLFAVDGEGDVVFDMRVILGAFRRWRGLYARARDWARNTARRNMTPAILARYSAGPCMSDAGLVMASARLPRVERLRCRDRSPRESLEPLPPTAACPATLVRRPRPSASSALQGKMTAAAAVA